MAKPAAKRVLSDDCVVIVAGERYSPHEGEWVEVQAGMPVSSWMHLQAWRALGPQLAAAQGEPDEGAQVRRLMAGAYEAALGHIARLLVAWSWTDDRGQPLPAPDGTTGPLQTLRAEEVWWLLQALERETPGERKNG